MTLDETLKEKILEVCRRIAEASHGQITAACLYGPWICGYADNGSNLNVLLILDKHPARIRGYRRRFNSFKVFILAVDQKFFESDVKQSWLGEFIAEKIMYPYEPLINDEYLWLHETEVKRRVILELLENLILEFPEMSHELLIEPEYFMYEAVARRARIFPLLIYGFLNMLREDLKEKNIERVMKGYCKALQKLAEEEVIESWNGYVKISEKFIKSVKSKKIKFPPVLRSLQKAAILHILSVFPWVMDSLTQERNIFTRSHRGVEAREAIIYLEETERHLLIPTPLGPIPLSDKTKIEDFIKKKMPYSNLSDIKIQEVGGVLNTVYLLTSRVDGEQYKIIVKKFKDWLGFKWFPLALWTLGTKTFAVSGKSRLEREYSINQFLQSRGFPVPKVLYVSPKERLIFEEFLEGESLVEVIKRIMSSKGDVKEDLELVEKAGRMVAEAHKLGVTLGDCKPENIMVGKDGKLYFVDLEQAERDGNKAWDIAEFLYYSGHYASPMSSMKGVELMAESFVRGYVEAGGDRENVRKASSPLYVKVFTIFTLPHVILAISNICKRIAAKME